MGHPIKTTVFLVLAAFAFAPPSRGDGIGGGGGLPISYSLSSAGPLTLTGLKPNGTYNLQIASTLQIFEMGKGKVTQTLPPKVETFTADAAGQHKILSWKTKALGTGKAGETKMHTLSFALRFKNPNGVAKSASSADYSYTVTLEAGKTVYPVGGQETIDCKDNGSIGGGG